MRSFAKLVTALALCSLLIAKPVDAVERGTYAIASLEFVGEEALIEASRNAPLVGDLMRSLEAGGADAYAEFDPDTSLFTTYAPDRESALRLDPETNDMFDGDRKIGQLREEADGVVIVEITDLPDFMPFGFQIRLEKAERDDPRIVAALAAIETRRAEEEARRLALLERLDATPPEGLAVALPDLRGEGVVGLALPRSFRYENTSVVASNIVRHDFRSVDGDAFTEIILFDAPDDASRQLVIDFFNGEHRWEDVVEANGARLGANPFDDALLLVDLTAAGRPFVAFAKTANVDLALEWRAILRSLAPIDEVEGPSLAEIIADPARLAAFEGEIGAAEDAMAACRAALPDLMDLEALVTAPTEVATDPFAAHSFPDLECALPLTGGAEAVRVTGIIAPGVASLDGFAAAEGVEVLLSETEALALSRSDRPGVYAALRRMEVDGIPVLLRATATTLSAARAFVEETASLDGAGLTVPEGWRRHIGAFRSLRPINDAPGFYEFTLDETPFEEGVLTADGDILVEAIYDDLEPVAGGFVLAGTDNLAGLIARDGTELLPRVYRRINAKGDDQLTLYRTDDKYQVYDLVQRKIVGDAYDSVEPIKGTTLSIVENGEEKRFVTRDMTPAFDGVFSHVRILGPDRFQVDTDKGGALIDETGEWIIAPAGDRLWAHANHQLIIATKDKRSIYFNYDGDRITSPGLRAHYAPSTEKGHITVSDEDGRWGVVDKTGAVVIEPHYARVHQFSEGLLPAAKRAGGGFRFGLIDETGTERMPFAYDNLHLVRDGRVWARRDGLWGLIDLDQAVIADFALEQISRSREMENHVTNEREKLSVAKKDGLYGVVSYATGEAVLPFEYAEADALSFRFRKDGQWLSYPYDFRE
ncbi:MAG: WG repeat-containing protein [Pseudomonadota bacterium]